MLAQTSDEIAEDGNKYLRGIWIFREIDQNKENVYAKSPISSDFISLRGDFPI